MRVSARNQLRGVVDAVEAGAVTSIVKVKVGDQVITASVTKEAAKSSRCLSGRRS
jgi:molybdopterin-binding protein